MDSSVQSNNLLALSEEIFWHTSGLVKHLKKNSINEPSLEEGSKTELWSSHAPEIENARSRIFGLTKELNKLLDGPHGFLHEYVSSNWDHGALYALLEHNVLEHIPFQGTAHVQDLSESTGVPADKIQCILRLNACEQITREVSDGVFGHTAISEELVKDKNFKAFIGFQLFETRVASAHLADSLKEPNPYWTGKSAFRYAWGSKMYDWHNANPEKGARFQSAMEGVTESLDPGNKLLYDWFSEKSESSRQKVVDVCGKMGMTSKFLARHFPQLTFEVQNSSEKLVAQGRHSLSSELQERIEFVEHGMFETQLINGSENVLAYVVRNLLWNMGDEECVKVLQAFLPTLEANPETVVLVNDLLCPAPGTFEPHVDKGYRRRDVTLTTMHNVKNRTEFEWRDLFAQVSPFLQFDLTAGFTSHSCRGLWEIRWKTSN